jgi:hypothetical protein
MSSMDVAWKPWRMNRSRQTCSSSGREVNGARPVRAARRAVDELGKGLGLVGGHAALTDKM